MAGLVPAIHVFSWCTAEDVDARVKPGHDELNGGAREIAPNRRLRVVFWARVLPRVENPP